jgi:uncharacterized sulfatase
MPHYPQYASENFAGQSRGGTYGDSVEELDHSIGVIMDRLDELGIGDDTIIIFTSDNGPWQEGDGGGFRGRKGTNFDGGQKVPFILRYRNSEITPGTVSDVPAMNIDLFPTILDILDIPPPTDRIIDGVSLKDDWYGEPHDLRDRYLYFIKGNSAYAVRHGDYKFYANISSENSAYFHLSYKNYLFNIRQDPRESWNIINYADYGEVADGLSERLEQFNKSISGKTNARGFP